jgi:hypothetical protein
MHSGAQSISLPEKMEKMEKIDVDDVARRDDAPGVPLDIIDGRLCLPDRPGF